MIKEMPTSRRLTDRRLRARRLFHLHRLTELASAIVLLVSLAGVGRAQSPQGPQGASHGQWGQQNPLSTDQSSNGPTGDPAMEAKRLNALNAERQKTMIADTEKLVKLAEELNEEVNGSNDGQLSADQLRKVAEIEKLAHSIREKMSTSVRPGPSMMDSPAFIPAMR
jgi:hypothetical protein